MENCSPFFVGKDAYENMDEITADITVDDLDREHGSCR